MSATAKRLALVMNISPISVSSVAKQEGGVEHIRFGTLFEEENGIASKIEELRTAENVQWEDFAVLTRTRAEGLRIQQRLKQVCSP